MQTERNLSQRAKRGVGVDAKLGIAFAGEVVGATNLGIRRRVGHGAPGNSKMAGRG
jgi:hypothetical protein